MKEQNAKLRPGKRGNSLVRKLTFNQAVRSFWGLVGFNIVIVAVFFAGLAAWTEWSAADILPRLDPGDEALEPFGAEYYYNDDPLIGVRLEWLENRLPLPEGTVRQLRWGEFHTPRELTNSLRYELRIPADGRTLYILYDWSLPVTIFMKCLLILCIIELFDWVTGIFKVRRSVRRTLRPIYELTRTAQTIQAPEPVHQRVAELQLSGTIETLNTITENRLDTRILIGDEREELQGLATAINGMLDRLDAAYQSQLRFVSDASHELRTPIAVIQGYANLLDRWGKEDEKTLQESIEAIKSEAAGMQDLVEQLLFLARSDNDSIVMKAERLDLSVLAEDVLGETRMIDPAHTFDSAFTPSLPVYGDAQLLKQALRIFVDNSIKYTPAGGRIALATRLDGDTARVSVTDQGIGIPEEELPHVFERFYRADDSRARETGGTGLGLSIARWIVDRHGGFVELVSRKDLGTRIAVVLPLYSDLTVKPQG